MDIVEQKVNQKPRATASQLILEWGVGATRTEGNGVLGEGAASPPHQLGGLRARSKLPQRGRGGAPAAEGFSCILCRQIAFPSISVRVAYSLHD